MSAIYGSISLAQKQFRNQDIVTKLGEDMYATNCIQYTFEKGLIRGGILIPKTHPYRKEDCFYHHAEKGIAVLFSGNLYNRTELTAEYLQVTTPLADPHLIAEIYLQRGVEPVNKFNGEFSFIITDQKKGATYIFRDHFGIRPLAYTFFEGCLYFASDHFSLCNIFHINDKLNPLYLYQYLTKNNLWEYKLTPCTGVKKLLPGHYICHQGNKTEQKKYWFPEKIRTDKNLRTDTLLSDLRSILTDSVRIRCDKRYTAAAHISGGMDSGLLALLVRKEYKNQKSFYGYSWSPEVLPDSVQKNDEREYARAIVKDAAIELKFSERTSDDFIVYLNNLRGRLGYFEESEVRKNAEKEGINLMFSGWGGDEFFSGNHPGVDSDLLFRFHWLTFLRYNPLSKPGYILKKIYYNVFLPAIGRESLFRGKKSSSPIQKYLFPEKIKKSKSKYTLNSWRSRRQVYKNYLHYNHLAARIEEWFILGYRSGLEYRYPFLDKRIAEYMFRVPSKLLAKRHRFIIREISKGILPDMVIKRSKLTDKAWGAMHNKQLFESFDILEKDIEKYKKNPLFDFVNFPVLEKDIKNFRENPRPEEFPEQFEIIYILKNIDVINRAFSD